MYGSEMGTWRSLLDENVDPRTATDLRKEDVRAEHVRDGCGPSESRFVHGT